MSKPVYRVCSVLCQVLGGVPVGTNLDLFCLLFAILSGRLLLFRGALFAALADLGLDKRAVRRAEAALQNGHFESSSLLANWRHLVAEEGHFRPHVFEGWRPVALDLSGFFRQRLQGCPNKHYHPIAGKAVPAIVFAIIVGVGSVGRMRLAVPRRIVRAEPQESDPDLSKRALREAKEALASDEVLVLDAGFALSDVLPTELRAFVVRVPKNFAAQRNEKPVYKGRGRPPVYGARVRPLPRTRKGEKIRATKPDGTAKWRDRGYRIRAAVYNNLVLSKARPGGASFRLIVVHDPRYKEPLLLATNLKITAHAVAQIYHDRWPIEQLPLAAKQMLGAERSFVFGDKSVYRLPELAILAGNMLSYIAACSDSIATGFWDRRARPTCGRLRRLLFRLHFSDLPISAGQLCKKNSATAHLKKGVAAHRRTKSETGAKWIARAA